MTSGEVLIAVVTGLAVNECCDVSPWIARKLVRWSAHRRYAPPARAEVRAEELTAYIDDRPGRLFKLITACGFAAAVVLTRKTAAPGVAPPVPQWWPTTPTIRVKYEHGKNEMSATAVNSNSKFCDVRRSCYQLTEEVCNAAKEVGVGSSSWRRCIKQLQRITGDNRWTLVERNLDLFAEIKRICEKPTTISWQDTAFMPMPLRGWRIPTDSTVRDYQAAAGTTRADIRRLVSDFLLRSAPH